MATRYNLVDAYVLSDVDPFLPGPPPCLVDKSITSSVSEFSIDDDLNSISVMSWRVNLMCEEYQN